MPEAIYEKLISSALGHAGAGTILDCAIGSNCLGIHTEQGTGLAFVTGEAWQLASAGSVSRIEESCRGRALSDVIPRYAENDPLAVNIALAAINSLHIYKGAPDTRNWFEWLRGKKRLGMVGYFCPIMERVALAGVEPVIFELRPIPGTHTPDEAPALMPGCDAVLITGAAFANKSVHQYLPHISPDADAFIFGHSTPLCDCLLERFTLGSTRVLDKDRAFAVIRAGGGIRDMKEHTLKIICEKIP